jgi:putative folate metabolism gamma-glutamate ligase
MVVTPIMTARVSPGEQTIFELLDLYLSDIKEQTAVAITSKIIALCDERSVVAGTADKSELIKKEADYYLSPETGKYNLQFTITQHTLIPSAGIDESNSGGHHVLWPRDAQAIANEICGYLKAKYDIKQLGVIITDSTCFPMRWGVVGIAVAYSGFRALNSYVGKPDLFGRPLKVSQAGVASALSASAVLAMGEGAEQTPIATITDVPFVKFQSRNPTKAELELFYIKNKDEDLFAPFLNSVKWKKGGNAQH